MRPNAVRSLFVALTLLVAFPVGIWGAGLVAAGVLTASGCAHTNSPSGFVSCMKDAKDEAPAMALLDALLDQNAMDALEAAFKLAPDAIRCLLTKQASVVGAGPVENVRARRAREFLDSHGLSLNLSNPAGASQIQFHWALPFEDMGIVVSVKTPGGSWPCGRGMRSYAWPPYAPDTVCVTDNPVIDVDKGLVMVGQTLATLSKPSPFKVARTVSPPDTGSGPGGG